jgi:hypothetical protein
MRKHFWTFVLAGALLATGGCSREGQETEESASEPVPERSGLPEDNVLSDQVKTLDKAEGVQQTLDDAAAKQREEIERQEQR